MAVDSHCTTVLLTFDDGGECPDFWIWTSSDSVVFSSGCCSGFVTIVDQCPLVEGCQAGNFSLASSVQGI